jgi:DNA-binding SARP family transcriptional activator/DNA-binding beta-propeller fold protein YncE/ABC-type branched-subunit amino acid transport system substrate-binding protein
VEEPGRRQEVLLLGPLAVLEDGRQVDLGGRMQRSLLALLLVRRGKVVSVDRLIDELWESAAPAGAAKTLQVYVSRLRRSLGPDAIERSGAGYLLRLPAEVVDLDRFERLYREGAALRADGNNAEARARLSAALELWRGPPLAELGDGPLAGIEVARLEELRLAVLEERIAADLDLGRQAALVPELNALVSEHPLRERLRELLMLALYRSGRQTDALEVYQHGREALRDQFGLEPGPELQELERAILNQAPELRATSRPPLPQRRRRWAILIVAGGLVLAAAATAALLIALHAGRSAGISTVAPDSLAEIDPGSNTVVAELPIGSGPVAVAVGSQSVWVANAGDQTVARVDPASRQVVARLGLGRIPSQLAVGAGRLWVASAVGLRGVVQGIDPAGMSIVETRTIRTGAGRGDDLFAAPTPDALAVGARTVWANNLHSKLARFDPGQPGVRTQALPPSHSVDGIAVGAGAVWVASGADDRVVRLDPQTGAVVAEIPIAVAQAARVASPFGIAVGFGSVWVSDALSNTVSELSPRLNAVVATIPVGIRPTAIAVGERAVWVLDAGAGTVTRIDPGRHAVVATIQVGRTVTGITAGLGGVWVTVAGGLATPTRSGHEASLHSLPLSSCSPAVHGQGAADVLIASELPTFRGDPTPDPVVADIRTAILDALRRRGFRAGRYRVAYQACDDSAPGQGPTPERCAANARLYSLNPSLLGVVGPFDSSCARIELPTLNAAAAGAVPVISPTNTYVGLTHAGPATAADEPDRYRPTGARNYVRLLGSDDYESTAIAMFLEHQGRHRVYLLDDGEGTGFAGASYVATAARKLGVAIVGWKTWNATATDYRTLSERAKRSRADAVVLSGCVCSNGLQVVTDLRAALGPNVTIIGTDNFADTADDFRTTFGPLGLIVAQAGRAAATLPPAGRTLLAQLARRRAPGDADPAAAYAAEAAIVLLDAIARSDGTRASVNRALFATHIRASLVGPIVFNADGDPTPAPITIYRVDAALPHRAHLGLQGLDAEQTYTPRIFGP